MTQYSGFSSPLLLGFDEIERLLDRVTKSTNDGFPPYNIERRPAESDQPALIRIILAVAGFAERDLEISLEENQLVIKGRQGEPQQQEFLHRGIAARQFQRIFVLADGLEVVCAELKNGLLAIDLAQPEPQRIAKTIPIRTV